MKKITAYRISLLNAIMESNHTNKEKKALVEAVRNTSDAKLALKIVDKLHEGKSKTKKK